MLIVLHGCGRPNPRLGLAATPLGGRFGGPEDIAPTVVVLAWEEAAWLTRKRINASGGVH